MTLDPNPYSPPLSASESAPTPMARTGNVILASAGGATRFVLRHPLAFVLFSLVLVVPIDLVDSYLDAHAEEFQLGPGYRLTMLVVANGIAAFSWVVLTEMARQDEAGEPSSVAAAVLLGLGNTLLVLVVCDLLVGLMVVVGLLLLILPGLYVGMRFFFLVPIVVVERRSVWRSLQASWTFTASRQWISLQLGTLLVLLLGVIVGWDMVLLGSWEMLPWDDMPEQAVELHWTFQPLWRIPATLLADWFTVLTFYSYWRLRQEGETAAIPLPPTSDHRSLTTDH
jgi:hypothetical protein